MADISSIQTLSVILDDGLYGIDIPIMFRYMKVFWINVRIIERLEATGKLDLRYPLPRMWSGYYYCLHENCVISSGAIEYQNQRIYYKENILYNAEINTIENAWNFQQLDVDEDLLDETSEDALWRNPNDPSFYFLPLQLPIDKVQFSLPAGVSVEVVFCGIKFSPIPYGVGGTYDLYKDEDDDGIPDDLRPLPDNPALFPPPDVSGVVSDFDAIARSRGYIPAGELPSACVAAGYQLISDAASFCASNGFYPVGTNRYLEVTVKLSAFSCVQRTTKYYYQLQSGEDTFTLVPWVADLMSCGQNHLGRTIRSNLSRNIDNFYYANIPNAISWRIITASSQPPVSSVNGW